MAKNHYCNVNQCHRCPNLGGEIMPGCMGTAVHPNTFDYCTCYRGEVTENGLLRKENFRLQKKVGVLEKQLIELKKRLATRPG